MWEGSGRSPTGGPWDTGERKMIFCSQQCFKEAVDHDPAVGHVTYETGIGF